MIRLLTCLLATLAAAFPVAATPVVPANPATLRTVLDHASGGDTIRLAPGSYDAVALRDRRWSPAVTIDATGAQLRSVRLGGVSGLTWRGGRFDGGDTERSGVAVQNSDHVTIDGAEFRHYLRVGIGLGSSSDIRLTGNVFAAMGSDGIDVAMSRRVVIDRNRCVDTKPTDGAHPDCVQLWSRPTEAPTADVMITNNEATGDTQGFTMFNHIRDGVDDGGFDRITIENNHARVSSYQAIAVYSCRDCVVRHNRVETLPNPLYPKVRAWVKVTGGSNVLNCDNLAESFPADPGRDKCR